MPRALVVSLHDVSPHTWEPCKRILAELDIPASLLVIPDHHGRGHFGKDAAFCEWLRSRVASGDEAVIHGYFHKRAVRDSESLATRIITRCYTSGEGEFFDITQDSARERAGRALGEFRSAGLSPCGFIAPAWLLSREGECALREVGIRYTTRLREVRDLTLGHRWKSQSLCWSARSAWRRMMSLAWNAHIFRREKNAPLMRIAIHPCDLAHPRIWRQAARFIRAASARREAMTYERWVCGSMG